MSQSVAPPVTPSPPSPEERKELENDAALVGYNLKMIRVRAQSFPLYVFLCN